LSQIIRKENEVRIMEKRKVKVKVKEKVETLTGVQVGVRAPRGSKITCKSWQTEAALEC
jgi:hypothetical protein